MPAAMCFCPERFRYAANFRVSCAVQVDNEHQVQITEECLTMNMTDIKKRALKISGILNDARVAAIDGLSRQIKKVDEHAELKKNSKEITEKALERLIALRDRFDFDAGVDDFRDRLEDFYRTGRIRIKRYHPPKDTRDLLEQTRRELGNVSACIMQISSKESSKLANQFGTAILPAASGIAASSALFSLVAALGTAGTGTAIGSLSGAAASSATLAWIGGVLGGGIAAGALLTGGVGIVVGLAAYKVLSSDSRSFGNLSLVEQNIVKLSWLAMTIVDEYLAGSPEQFTKKEADLLLVNFFRPLLEDMTNHKEAISQELDEWHGMIFRVNVLSDFENVVIGGVNRYIEGAYAWQS